jgi:hypothetical protein
LCFYEENSLDNYREVQSRFEWLNAFFRSYYSFLALTDKCVELDKAHDNLHPFTHLHNVLLYDTVINWCKIFGTDTEECHWKKVILDHDEFRIYLLSKIAKTQKEFSEYHKEVLSFRNKWVVHFDPKYQHPKIPFFEIAHDSAVALHSYLKENSAKQLTYAGPEDIEQFGKNVARILIPY